MAHQTTKQFSDYIGIAHDYLDCWGLVTMFYEREFGLILKTPYSTIPSSKDEAQSFVLNCVSCYKKVDKPKYGDIILFKVMGLLSHVAIYLDEEKMLHSDSGHDSVIESWNCGKWKNRVFGFYRPI